MQTLQHNGEPVRPAEKGKTMSKARNEDKADASLVHPREVFRGAIRNGACSVILAHNHPSGDCTPSAEDIRITKNLVEAGKIIDIKVMDHVVIGRKTELTTVDHVSLRESGLVDFN